MGEPEQINVKKGEALRRLMEKRGVTQPALLKFLGYSSRGAISLWWKGKHWPSALEGKLETLLTVSPGFFERIGAGADYDELVNVPFASSRLAPPALRAVGDEVREPIVYEQEQYEEGDMPKGGRRDRADELGRRVREALLMEPKTPDVARVLRRHQDTLEGSVDALTELIFRVGKRAAVS